MVDFHHYLNLTIVYIHFQPKVSILKPIFHCNAYIPLQHKNIVLSIPTCWYLKTLKFALPPTRNIIFELPPTKKKNTSQWNIGCVGSPTQNFRIGHVHFMLFVPILFALGIQREPSLQWNMGLKDVRRACHSKPVISYSIYVPSDQTVHQISKPYMCL